MFYANKKMRYFLELRGSGYFRQFDKHESNVHHQQYNEFCESFLSLIN